MCDTVRKVNCRRHRAWYVAMIQETREIKTNLVRKPLGKCPLEDKANWKITLRWILGGRCENWWME
jgi:hypothetical protein